MGDDIVTRLRAAARSGDLALGVSFDCDAVADEIERLRAVGDEMVDAATRQQWSRLDVAVGAWQEARRG